MAEDHGLNYEEYARYLEGSKTPSEEFVEMYGFPHECHCSEDWLTGEVGVVANCWLQMSDDALEQCHKYKGELADRERKLAILRTQVASKGETPLV